MATPPISQAEISSFLETVWRRESPRLVAALTRMVRDIGLAEELAQDALTAALQSWPQNGVPTNPGAWLMATAKRRAIDRFRHTAMAREKLEAVRHDTETDAGQPDLDAMLDDDIGDDLLRMIFTACHPVLSIEARTALALKLVGGLTTTEIARAFLVPEPTVAQRLVRAKRTLAEARIPFEVPRGTERDARLAAVLGVIYLIFNEGYSSTAGEDLLRPALMEEAIRLGAILVQFAGDEPEVLGLLALMEIQASRRWARTDAKGSPILLLNQNRTLWDRDAIGRGDVHIARALARAAQPGPYLLQAQIGACHARALLAEETDWSQIRTHYDGLYQLLPTPVIALNRAVAIGMADGPQAGLDLVDALATSSQLKSYHLLQSVRGEFLFRLKRYGDAAVAYRQAAALAQNTRERSLLEAREEECRSLMG